MAKPHGADNYYIGDAIGLAMADGMAYATWTDTRNGNQDIFFATFPITPAPAAPNDRFEPNDVAASSTWLGTLVNRYLPKLHVASGDEDWFSVRAAATGELSAVARWETGVDMIRMQLWDVSGLQLLAESQSLTDASGAKIGEVLAAPSRTGERYVVRVLPGSSGSDMDGTRYSLQLQCLTQDLGTAVHGVVSGHFATNDEIYYLLAAGAVGSLQVSVRAGPALSGGLHVQVLDPQTLSVLASDANVPGQAALSVRAGQQVLLRVYGASAGEDDFALEFTNFDQFATSENRTLFFPAGAGPSQAAIDDFNGDGLLDVVVADAVADTLSILLGNGDGTLQAARECILGAFRTPNSASAQFRLPTYRRDLAVADFNCDGHRDVVVTNYDSADISVLLGRGDGTFEPQRRFDATAAPFGLAVGNFNSDGYPDVAVISAEAVPPTSVEVLLGRGDGTFLPQPVFAVPTVNMWSPGTLRAADVNEDGKDDLVISGDNAYKVYTAIGRGDGTFDLGEPFPASRYAPALAVGDVNGDKHIDIVTAGVELHDLSVLLGNGNNTFVKQAGLFAGQAPVSLILADVVGETAAGGTPEAINPDGQLDILVAAAGTAMAISPMGPPGVMVLPGLRKDGKFSGFGKARLLMSAKAPLDVDACDLNRDGSTDLVVVDQDGLLVLYGKPPQIQPNDSPATARRLGTVVHVLQPTLSIVPGHAEAYYSLTVPTEALAGAGDEVVDVSALFAHEEGAGLMVRVLDAGGRLLGEGSRLRLRAAQSQQLFVHIFGQQDAQGQRGCGAYTLDINVLPQLVGAEAQAFLPGVGNRPGGPTSVLVLTLQGDRLDPATAQNPANYQVTWLGSDGLLGTGDDQRIALSKSSQAVIYNPSANVDVVTGTNYPTAVRQTVTLLFPEALPPGSYHIALSEAIQSVSLSKEEGLLLAGGIAGEGHPVVSLVGNTVVPGDTLLAADLVKPAGELGDLRQFAAGTPFLSQLHSDLGAILDAALTELSDDPSITSRLLEQILQRLLPGLVLPDGSYLPMLVLMVDPLTSTVVDPLNRRMQHSLETGQMISELPNASFSVVSNVELMTLPAMAGMYAVHLSTLHETSRLGALKIEPHSIQVELLTEQVRSGVRDFAFYFGSLPESTISEVTRIVPEVVGSQATFTPIAFEPAGNETPLAPANPTTPVAAPGPAPASTTVQASPTSASPVGPMRTEPVLVPARPPQLWFTFKSMVSETPLAVAGAAMDVARTAFGLFAPIPLLFPPRRELRSDAAPSDPSPARQTVAADAIENDLQVDSNDIQVAPAILDCITFCPTTARAAPDQPADWSQRQPAPAHAAGAVLAAAVSAMLALLRKRKRTARPA